MQKKLCFKHTSFPEPYLKPVKSFLTENVINQWTIVKRYMLLKQVAGSFELFKKENLM